LLFSLTGREYISSIVERVEAPTRSTAYEGRRTVAAPAPRNSDQNSPSAIQKHGSVTTR
jgi:hypothetical protein